MPRGSQQIRQARKALGWSQLDLAAEAEVSPRTVQFAETGENCVSNATIVQISEALGIDPEEAARPEAENEEDHFSALPWSATGWIKKKVKPRSDSFCHNESEILEVLAVMRENWKNHLDRGDTRKHHDGDVFYNADEKLNQSYFSYEQRYLSIWRRNPLTVMLANSGNTRTGAAISLPVTDEAYERLRDGEINFMEITADDVLEESQNLILDHAVEFPTKPSSWHRITESLSYTVFCQIAMLAVRPSAEDFRMLSFGASPINIQRLEGFGFELNGVRMPDFDYPMCEFIVDNDCEDDQRYTTTSTLVHFAHLLRRITPKVSKKRVICSTLSALQKVVKRRNRSVLPMLESDANVA